MSFNAIISVLSAQSMPNLEKLIGEFEKSSTSISENRRVVSPSLTSSGGSIVKKIVEAFELQTIKNAQQKQDERRFSCDDTLGNRKYNRRTFSGSTPAIYHKFDDDLQNRKDFRVSSITNIDTKDCNEVDFLATNRYYSYGNKMKTLQLGPKVLPDIKFVSEDDMRMMRVQPSSFKKIETKSLDQMFFNPSKDEAGNQLITRKCRSSSPLDSKDNDECYVLDDILTNSQISSNSSNNSYKNLRMKLYEFDNEWQRESTPVLQTSSGLRHDTMSNDDVSQTDSSFQSISKDITISGDLSSDPQNVTRIARSIGPKFDQKPQILGAFLKVPVKISNTSVSWIPTLNGKLPRKNSLKKMVSIFTSRRRIIESKLKKKLKKQRRTYDLESSSSSSQYSWYSEPDISINYQSLSPTFETFGRTSVSNSDQVNRSNKSRLVLTELAREELATNYEPFKSISASSSSQANHWNFDASKRANMESSPKSKISYEYLSIPKHPHLFEKRVSKHPFVARTKIDKLQKKARVTKARERAGTKKEFDTYEREDSIVSPSSTSSANISISEISEWVTSSPNNIHDIPKQDHRSTKSMSALDEYCSEVPPIDHIFRSRSEHFPPCISPMKSRKKPFTVFPTISLKNLRRLISQEKLHTFGDSIDV